MSELSVNDPCVVFDYEVDMFRSMTALLEQGNSQYNSFGKYLRNTVVESAVLHTRNLEEIFANVKNDSDDITIADLLPNFESDELDQLRVKYNGPESEGSLSWAFNKMLGHPTKHRSSGYDYSAQLNALAPLINSIIVEVNSQRPGGR
jgi:hypothetical protein